MFSVSRHAGVSLATVSRALNHPHLVKSETRTRVTQAIKELGYIRNRAPKADQKRKSGTIGLIVPTLNNTIFAEMIQNAMDVLSENDFTVFLAAHGFNNHREYEILRKLLEHRVDGIGLIGVEHKPETLKLIKQQKVPTVTAWQYAKDAPLPCIGSDNVKAGQLAARHLIDLGHQKIAMMFPDVRKNSRALDRQKGAQRALEAAQLESPEHFKITVPYSVKEAKEAGMDLLSLRDRPTAILCGNDVIATGAIYAAQHAGLRVPQEVSIMGIGDFAGSDDIVPSLSTIRIPARRIGILFGQYLVEATQIGHHHKIPSTEFDVKLVDRQSTKRFS